MKICSIDGCEGQVSSRGWCEKHYTRWRRHGDPLILKQLQNHGLPLHERYISLVTLSDNGYWTWTGAFDTSGYGFLWNEGKTVAAHRYAYEHYVGPIPDGMEVDHCCRIRNCVDIRCLDVVIPAENNRRRFLTPEEHWALRPKREVFV